MLYFISDLHLNELNLASTNLLRKFLTKYAPQAEAIYILGDFFDSWIGDDYSTPFIQSIINALSDLHNKGVTIFFMHGNRDFLLGEQVLAKMHCTLLPDPYVIKLNKASMLLTHGDILTVADVRYNGFRKFTRQKIVKKLFLSLPQKIRLNFARFLRAKSQDIKVKFRAKPELFAVSSAEVKSYIETYDVDGIIHGHTHMPAIHEFISITNKPCKRIVLGEWGDQAKILSYNDGEFALIEIRNE